MGLFARILTGLLVGTALCAVGLVGWRIARQQVTADMLRIRSPDGVQEAGYTRINGLDQWIQVRGEHRRNPILLFVHGGPGFSMSPLTPIFRSWEADFTVAQWDQRNAGLTFSRTGAQPLSLDQAARDGIAVVEHLRGRLGNRKIVVLGHSWGSAVALEMVLRRPELFAAYVGTGQMSSKAEQEAISYATVLARLRARGDAKGVAELEAAGPPPYPTLASLLVQRKWLARVDTTEEQTLFRRMAPLVLASPNLRLREAWDYNAAPKVAQQATYDELARFEARALGMHYAVPMFIFQGDQDLYTPAEPNARYLREIAAPSKAFVLLAGGGHSVVLTRPDIFLAELRVRVRPLAMDKGPPLSALQSQR